MARNSLTVGGSRHLLALAGALLTYGLIIAVLMVVTCEHSQRRLGKLTSVEFEVIMKPTATSAA